MGEGKRKELESDRENTEKKKKLADEKWMVDVLKKGQEDERSGEEEQEKGRKERLE